MIEKEFRALLPLWVGCAVALCASAAGVYPLQYFGVPLYFATVAGLGAFSIGHEYTYHTLGIALTMPVPRWRIWATKLGVLLPMIAALAAVAARTVALDRAEREFGTGFFWLPALAAIGIAPWLTMVARSPLASTVFTIGIVGGSMGLGEWIGVALYGFTRQVDVFRAAFMWWAISGLSVAGVVMGWRAFGRLELGGSAAADVQLRFGAPEAATSTRPVRRTHPFVAQVLKEIRLQQLSLVVAAVCTAGGIAVALLWRQSSDVLGVMSVLTTCYMVVMPALIGSLAGAEERHLGTHEPQLLLPVSISRQWIVKAGTAICLSLTLALLLPSILTAVLPGHGYGLLGPRRQVIQPETVAAVVYCATISLYVSSVAKNGLTALFMSIGAIMGTQIGTLWMLTSVSDKVFSLVHQFRAAHDERTLLLRRDPDWLPALVVFVLVVGAFALSNYRYADRRLARVAVHVAVTAAGIAAYAALLGAMNALRF